MEKIQNLKLIIILFYIQYKKILTFLALIFGSSFEATKRNKNLTTLLKNSFDVISLFIIKIKVI